MDCLGFFVSVGHIGFQISLSEFVFFVHELIGFYYPAQIFYLCIYYLVKIYFYIYCGLPLLAYVRKKCKSISFVCMPVLTKG